MRKFAQHFIFWRRAIAIPPLHARDMYIVSPNCDLTRLPQAATQWARQFPLSPTLPNFLAELSVAPRPYKLHCPSKAHRPVYMAMLAWLMRGGWVTQLCTFAYVVVWPEIIYEVEHALEAEEIARAKRVQNLGREPGSLESDDAAAATTSSPGVTALGDAAIAGFASGFLPLNFDHPSPTGSSATAGLRDLNLSHSHSSLIPGTTSSASTPTSPSPPPHHHHARTNNNHNNITPTTNTKPTKPVPTRAEQAAEKARLARVADKAARELAERATAHARKALPLATAHPSVNHARHLQGMVAHVILDAKKATGKESLYLSAIGKRFRDRAEAAAAAKKKTLAVVGPGHNNGGKRRAEGGGGGGGGGSSAGARGSLGVGVGSGGFPHGASPGGAGAGAGAGAAFSGGGAGGGIRDGGGEWEERVANAWPVFCKYFNGRSAQERIALQEDMKRKDVWNLLTAMSEYLLCVRHW